MTNNTPICQKIEVDDENHKEWDRFGRPLAVGGSLEQWASELGWCGDKELGILGTFRELAESIGCELEVAGVSESTFMALTPTGNVALVGEEQVCDYLFFSHDQTSPLYRVERAYAWGGSKLIVEHQTALLGSRVLVGALLPDFLDNHVFNQKIASLRRKSA